MSTPIGHSLFGITLARRLGLRSPAAMVAATVAASLPDADVIAGWVLHRDPWKLHRKGTHTLSFAVTAGMLAGFTGIVSAGSTGGDRDVVADTLTGALLVGSHVVLDNVWFPYLSPERGAPARKVAGISTINWLIDAVIYGALAWWLWPRPASPDATE